MAFMRCAIWDGIGRNLHIFLWNSPCAQFAFSIFCVFQRCFDLMVLSKVGYEVVLWMLIHVLLEFMRSSSLSFAFKASASWDRSFLSIIILSVWFASTFVNIWFIALWVSTDWVTGLIFTELNIFLWNNPLMSKSLLLISSVLK